MPVPVIVPPDQLEAGLGPLIVSSATREHAAGLIEDGRSRGRVEDRCPAVDVRARRAVGAQDCGRAGRELGGAGAVSVETALSIWLPPPNCSDPPSSTEKVPTLLFGPPSARLSVPC